MPTIDDTSEAMFGYNLNPQGILSTIREIKALTDSFRPPSGETETEYGNINQFTGQHTDIAYTATDRGVTLIDINNIKDSELRSNVIYCYSDAIIDGYLDYDKQTDKFTLTEKGREHINSSAFKEQFEKDQYRKISENKAVVTLKGSKSDLNIFRYADEINLKMVTCNPTDYKNISEFFRRCEKYGWVTVSNSGIIKPTEKCLSYLSKNAAKDFKIAKLTSDNLKEVFANISRKAAAQTAKVGVKTAVGTSTAGISAAVDVIIQLSKQGVKALDRLTNLNKNTASKRS